MIYPYPYNTAGGKKLYPIFGVNASYSISEGNIQSALIADPPTAFYLNEVGVVSGDEYAFHGVADTISVLWAENFSGISAGYNYVLFPNLSPTYPNFISYANMGEISIPGGRFELQPATPLGGQLYWNINTSFDFEGNSYTLYIIRGYGALTRPVISVNFHLTTLPANN
jgi:hypothetical protein